eukprot:1160983-Pelagomonas_calceolata.AAC.1
MALGMMTLGITDPTDGLGDGLGDDGLGDHGPHLPPLALARADSDLEARSEEELKEAAAAAAAAGEQKGKGGRARQEGALGDLTESQAEEAALQTRPGAFYRVPGTALQGRGCLLLYLFARVVKDVSGGINRVPGAGAALQVQDTSCPH